MFWRSSERAIRESVRNALRIASEKSYRSIAFPVVGTGTGGFAIEQAITIMKEEAEQSSYTGDVHIVRFKK